MVKHMIFDVDGTLVQTSHVTTKGLQGVLKRRNIHLDLKELMIYDGLPSHVTMDAFHIQDPDDAIKEWQAYVHNHHHLFALYYGIETILEVLSSWNITLSIVTSRTQSEIQVDDILPPILHYFQHIISADDTINHKPSGDPLRYLMKISQHALEDSIYIGDSLYDYKAALDCKMSFAHAVWGEKKFDTINVHQLKTPIDIIKLF